MPHTAVTLDPLRHLVIISADQALTHKLVATVQEVARGATVHVTTVADFDPALDLIERERPQAAVIDLRLPGSNVPALIAHLSRNGRRPLPAPMVAICEAGAESAAALKAGIHDCIERTATAHDLEQALHRARLAWHTQKLLAEQEQDTVDAHQRAKRAEAEFELLADTAPAMLWQADRRGHRHWFSRAWYAFTGLASQSPTDAQAAWLDAVFPSDQELCRSLSTLLERGTGRFRVEYRLRDQTGRFRWVEDACEPSDAGGFVGCCIDIDERKRTEAMLAEREQVLSAMVAKAAVGLAEITAHDRRIRTANPHLIRMLRTSADDLLGSELQEWVHPGATQRIDQAFAALAQHGKALRLPDLRCWSARGRSVWVDLTLSPVHHEEDGRLHGAVAALQSITVHREQSRAIEQRTQQLSEKA
ncbi:MAG: PAS domain S-box protein, partial [Planctomycetota bacterium]|nr:PAS domain S-box protein [Planctomycetota bacterium]